jgi:hypothetical protein
MPRRPGEKEQIMKIQLSTVLNTLEGEPFRIDENELMTLGKLVIRSLLMPFEGDRADGQAKAKRFEMAIELHGQQEADLSNDDIKMLKDLLGHMWATVVVGQAHRLLDGKEQAKWEVDSSSNGHRSELVSETEEVNV